MAVPHHPYSKKFLPNTQSEPVLLQLKAILPCPMIISPYENSLSNWYDSYRVI